MPVSQKLLHTLQRVGYPDEYLDELEYGILEKAVKDFNKIDYIFKGTYNNENTIFVIADNILVGYMEDKIYIDQSINRTNTVVFKLLKIRSFWGVRDVFDINHKVAFRLGNSMYWISNLERVEVINILKYIRDKVYSENFKVVI